MPHPFAPEPPSTLDRGERELWTGAPRRGLVLRTSDLLLVPFSLVWGGFAFFWEWQVLQKGAPVFMAFFGVPFVLMGLYITVGRFLVDARRRSRTTYTLTSERVIIRSGIAGLTTTSLQLRSVGEVHVSERSDGSGTITFGSAPMPFRAFQGTSWPGAPQVPAFEMIPDVQNVAARIRGAQRTAGTSSF
jgi:hypothetical protein